MSKTIVIENGDVEVTQEEIEEIKQELSEHIENVEEELEEKTDDSKEEILEEVSETIEEKTDDIKEEVKSWLEQALSPIAETLTALTTGLLSLAEKVENLRMTPDLSTPQQSNTETITNETPAEISLLEQVESPVESAVESLAEATEQVQELPQNLAREIVKL